MKSVVFGLVASLLSAIYWWIVFTLVYADALFAGDRKPGSSPPSDQDVLIHSVSTIATGVVLYAVLATIWHRMAIRRQQNKNRVIETT